MDTPLGTTTAGADTARMSLGQFAGQNGLQLIIPGGQAGDLGRIIIGFAERGEQIGIGGEDILLDSAFLGAKCDSADSRVHAGVV